ncbi:unnamed protein product [Boreogadus saida]
MLCYFDEGLMPGQLRVLRAPEEQVEKQGLNSLLLHSFRALPAVEPTQHGETGPRGICGHKYTVLMAECGAQSGRGDLLKIGRFEADLWWTKGATATSWQ